MALKLNAEEALVAIWPNEAEKAIEFTSALQQDPCCCSLGIRQTKHVPWVSSLAH